MSNCFQLTKVAASLAVLGGLGLFSAQAMAATPLAGTNISNIATASYVDNTNTPRTVTSNEVTTSVAQVGSFTLVADRTAETTPNGKVEMHHVLTNTGNGTDTFTIDLDSKYVGTFEFEKDKFAVYLDKNLDGIPDNNTNLAAVDANGKPLHKVELQAGENVGLVVVATTPNTNPSDKDIAKFDKLTLTVTSEKTDSIYIKPDEAKKTNTDTVTLTSGAVVSITKAASINSAKVGDEIEYTLTFKNTGNATANNVAIFDVLPSNVQYIANSAKYSASANSLTDGLDQDNYTFFKVEKDEEGKIIKAERVLLNVPQLAANTTATLKFKVKVLESSLNSVDNTAYVDPNGNNNTPYSETDIPNLPTSPKPTDSTPSNESKVPVLGVYSGSLTDSASDKRKDTGETVAPDGFDSIVVEGQQGVPVIFGAGKSEPIYVHNVGNSVDTYNLTIDKNLFKVTIKEKDENGQEVSKELSTEKLPAGSIVEILKSDGATPVTDTNGDGIVDTGPIQPNSSVQFVVRVTLPNGTVVDNAFGGIGIKLESTSTTTGDKDTLKLITSTMSENKVDLVNKDKGEPVEGVGKGTGDSVDTNTTKPGTPTTFDITIQNKGNISDNYVIKVPNVPEDWTVEVFEKVGDQCTTTKVTNSGNIPASGEKSFCVVVTPPADSPAGTDKKINVDISSPSTGTTDNITFNVVVDEQRSLTFTPDRQGQVAPGGTVEYVHTLTNTGNVVEGAEATKPNNEKTAYTLDIDWTSTMTNVNTSIYVDLNNNGQADTSELITGNSDKERNASLATLLATTNVANTTNKEPGLSPNESIQIIVKVQTPATATAGEKDTTILTFTPQGTGAPNPVTVTDLTTINLGQVRLSKTQAKAVACGTVPADTAFVSGNITAKPGECVYYRVTAVNDGNEAAKDVKISDMVPSYTTYLENSISPEKGATEEEVGKTTEPTASSRAVKYNVGTLTPAAKATLEFAVQVDK